MIKRLDWDSDFFGLRIGEAFYEEKLTSTPDYDLLYVKANNDFDAQIEGFENGFSEVKLVFSKALVEGNHEANPIVSIDQIPYDKQEIYDLAYESGKFSRFFLDTHFTVEKFRELYQKWIDNSISKTIADDVLVYVEGNDITGFVTYKTNNDLATIGLIAVSPDHQGKGIGGKLLQFLEGSLWKKNIRKLQIPTQENNLAACNFYKKQGYGISERTFIKHYWSVKLI
ncbi:GNAT family N-acetyltransferase [Flavobacterium pallidum]|uniref:N-acetyltransferase domain-containing protein n=1 Tax=Flavobacterium pallidum TaxID=2172098 RepID=A0A2S1SF95_9FLAO|nr:GNAT family N-acetyltransferase [Flavobacterium pallidum]AWI25078.1 hypothetical protein HYN49_03755 [Flavobacterium pallidum]